MSVPLQLGNKVYMYELMDGNAECIPSSLQLSPSVNGRARCGCVVRGGRERAHWLTQRRTRPRVRNSWTHNSFRIDCRILWVLFAPVIYLTSISSRKSRSLTFQAALDAITFPLSRVPDAQRPTPDVLAVFLPLLIVFCPLMAAAVPSSSSSSAPNSEQDALKALTFQRLHPKTYLERFLAENVRPDGRDLGEWRDISLNVGVCS